MNNAARSISRVLNALESQGSKERVAAAGWVEEGGVGVGEVGSGRKRREEAVRRFSILLFLLFRPSLFFRCLMNVVCNGIKKKRNSS